MALIWSGVHMSARIGRLVLIASLAIANALWIAIPASALDSQTLTFRPPASLTLRQTPYLLSGTATSTLPVSYASSTAAVCTVSGNLLTLVATGTCTVTASQSGDATFAAAAPVTKSISITNASQRLRLKLPSSLTLRQTPFTLRATASSRLMVSWASSTASVCTVSGSTLTLLATGTCTVTASQQGDATYKAASAVTKSISVTKASQSLRLKVPESLNLRKTPYPLLATASSKLPVSVASSPSSVCTVSGTTLTVVATGTCTVTASQEGDAIYKPASSVTRSISVTKSSQSLKVKLPSILTLRQTPYPFSATATSGLPVSMSSSTATVCTVAESTLTLVAPGTCTVTASQDGNETYAAASSVTKSISVTKVNQSLKFKAPASLTIRQASYPLTATVSSGLTVAFSSTTGTVCTVAGTTLNLLATGTCTVTASQPGDATYASSSVTKSISVTKVSQSVRFKAPASLTLLQTPYTLSAMASSGLTVAFSSSPPSVCTVSGTTLALLTTGTCTVTASQSGDETYASSATVTRSISITNVS